MQLFIRWSCSEHSYNGFECVRKEYDEKQRVENWVEPLINVRNDLRNSTTGSNLNNQRPYCHHEEFAIFYFKFYQILFCERTVSNYIKNFKPNSAP